LRWRGGWFERRFWRLLDEAFWLELKAAAEGFLACMDLAGLTAGDLIRRHQADATRTIANDILDNLIKAVGYKIPTVLADNTFQFTQREGTQAYWTIPLDRLCDALGIAPRLTKITHPWTNGQVERMNRTIKVATVKRYHVGYF
jgi:hypothetical protein